MMGSVEINATIHHLPAGMKIAAKTVEIANLNLPPNKVAWPLQLKVIQYFRYAPDIDARQRSRDDQQGSVLLEPKDPHEVAFLSVGQADPACVHRVI